jgi:hypothetical protein
MKRTGESIVFTCPHCGCRAEVRAEYHRNLVVVCGRCGEDVSPSYRRAFFREIAADMNARIVEQENRDFLRYLSGGWDRPESGPHPGRNR